MSPARFNCHVEIDSWFRPYYIWLGRSRSCDVTRFCHAFEVEGGSTIGNCSPVLSLDFKPPLVVANDNSEPRSPSDDRRSVINITAPLSSFHYQIKKVSAVPNFAVEFYSSHNFSPGVCLTMSNLYTRNFGPSYTLLHGCVQLS